MLFAVDEFADAMIMDLRKRFFRMTDALFFHRLLHRRNKSSTDSSQQPTERMVTDAILKSELHAFQRMVQISCERSQWVFTAPSMSQRKKKLWHNGGFRYSAGVDMALVVARKAERMDAIPGTRTGSEILNPFVEGS